MYPIVERPVHEPGVCAVTLSSEDPRGFVDTGNTPRFVDPRIYVSFQGVVELARSIGLPSPDEFVNLKHELDNANQALTVLRNELADKQAQLDAVYVLRNNGFKDGAKPGRPKKTEVSA